MYIKYHKMAIVIAFLNCYGIPNLLVDLRENSMRILLNSKQLKKYSMVEQFSN